jgi:hypothetical protein
MAFSGNFVCDSFKTELFEGVHTFGVGGDQFKIALYDNNASFNASTTAYTATNEVAATGTYTAGGGNLTSLPLDISSNTVLVDFSDISFTGVTFEPYGALIYNSSVSGNPAAFVLDFGGPKQAISETFTIVFPPFTLTQAFVRLA